MTSQTSHTAMRINQFVAQATGLSRRAADTVISQGRVTIQGKSAQLGDRVDPNDHILLDGQPITLPETKLTLILHKPVGYVCSRDGQGSPTIYELLPETAHHLKPVGRLDKDSSGLLLLTNDGQLAHQLTHPSFQKEKVYQVKLDKPLRPADQTKVEQGVLLDDGLSAFRIQSKPPSYQVRLSEGRNRQIRRTFAAIGYNVTKLHRTQFGDYSLDDLPPGQWKNVV